MGKPKEIYPEDEDDSYFFNTLYYNNIQFSQSINGFSEIILDSGTGSYISSSHNERFNFDKDEDFSISFYLKAKAQAHVKVVSVGSAEIGKDFVVGTFESSVISWLPLDDKKNDPGFISKPYKPEGIDIMLAF